MKFKPFQAVVIQDDPLYLELGLSRMGQEVTVIADVPGHRNLKCRDQEGTIFYYHPAWLREKSMGNNLNSLTKGNIEEMDNDVKKISFEDLLKEVFALAYMTATCEKNASNLHVIELAKRTIYEDCKNGCYWEEKQ